MLNFRKLQPHVLRKKYCNRFRRFGGFNGYGLIKYYDMGSTRENLFSVVCEQQRHIPMRAD